jgi:prepilin-type N-terminal cleavage/methylation domain-containing protein
MSKQSGFTLLEVLLSMAILGVILMVVSQGIGSGNTTLGLAVSKSDLLEETRNAGQIMTDEIAKASYIYPPGTTLNLGTDYSVRQPGASVAVGGTAWKTGVAATPMMAMILPPGSFGTCSSTDTQFCSTFVAYYPVLRSEVEQNLKVNSVRVLQVTSWTSSLWTLYEYRCSLRFKELDATAVPPTDLTLTANCGTASKSLMLDYVQPYNATSTVSGFAIDYLASTNACRRPVSGSAKFEAIDCATLKSDLTALAGPPAVPAKYTQGRFTTVVQGRFSLRLRIQQRSDVKVETPEFLFPITPRNLYTI